MSPWLVGGSVACLRTGIVPRPEVEDGGSRDGGKGTEGRWEWAFFFEDLGVDIDVEEEEGESGEYRLEFVLSEAIG